MNYTPKRMHLFQGFGIELEYMIVNKDTLDIMPIADKLFKSVTGKYESEFCNGPVTWSNELTLHVIELKCTEPITNFEKLNEDLHINVLQINDILNKYHAKLLPTAAHPWMNPQKDTWLWPHAGSSIYDTYHKIFDCRKHGWANLQSTHINLPFYDDEEFAPLHIATRLVLPIIPALCASSPILEQQFTGYLDGRLFHYENIQNIIPSISGKVIPERVFSKHSYHKKIYDPIASGIAEYDANKILNPVWLNSRGAIPRFDRGSLEIRLIDIQENHGADLAIAALLVHLIKLLVTEKLSSFDMQKNWEIKPLYKIFRQTIKEGQTAIIDNPEYLSIFGINEMKLSAGNLWKSLISKVIQYFPEELLPWSPQLNTIVTKGNLSQRIMTVLNEVYTKENMRLVYNELSENLVNNEMFEACEQSKLS